MRHDQETYHHIDFHTERAAIVSANEMESTLSDIY